MKKCYIITSYIEGRLSKIISPEKSDFIICADGGYDIAVSENIKPDLVIGDSDSGDMGAIDDCGVEIIRFPGEKDESDTFLCVKHAVNLGFGEITIVGGIGGRLDHTIANIQTLAYFSDPYKRLVMLDENNYATILMNSKITLQKRDGFSVSLFSLSDRCLGVTASGLCYPLRDAELTNSYPLGLSNAFAGGEAVI